MDVKAAVEMGKRYIAEVFEGEEIKNIGLEEVDFDEAKGVWYVTVGFSRPWDEPKNAFSALTGQGAHTKRSFKTIQISDQSAIAMSIKNRDIAL